MSLGGSLAAARGSCRVPRANHVSCAGWRGDDSQDETRVETDESPAMNRCNMFHRMPGQRRGTTVVETALVLPVFLLFVLALIELGHAQLVKHVLRSACRQAARIGTTEGKTTADVRSRVLATLESVVNANDVEVYVKDAGAYDSGGSPPETGSELEALPNIELSNAVPLQLFMVRAKINYHDIAIVPNIPYLGSFLDGVVLEGQAFMRHE